VALAIDGMAVTDRIIDLHDRIIGKLFSIGQNKHQQRLGLRQAINDKVRLAGASAGILEARKAAPIPSRIEIRPSWDAGRGQRRGSAKLAQPAQIRFPAPHWRAMPRCAVMPSIPGGAEAAGGAGHKGASLTPSTCCAA
jgi:hypothetical protein